ncbi:hypothetical protein [Emticicia agri]|uniref:Uncharacterized protein n=1 Tax=Emticicia agri TaxID=2492393 RepID=A0A4Q5LWK9_9BACT|nr:hypothetical protein [Emticicia agri]RYU94186.1 hypothetical protein EWM59_17955 [Emticicia agri]
MIADKEMFLINGKAVEQDLERISQSIQEAKELLASTGTGVSLNDWLTIKKYCERFGIKNTETVINWIRRGIIPPENVQVIEELNGIRLIKAVPYKD